MKKIVIIGGAAAGATAAARLRRLDLEAQIVLFEKGEYISYASCGLPYYIGDMVPQRDSLLAQTVEGMTKRYNLDIRIETEVTNIHRSNKTITAKHVKTGEQYEETYDVLILATGATPVIPNIPGIDQANNVFTLKTIPDADEIKNWMKEREPAQAVVLGGSLTAIELAENLQKRGLQVTIIEENSQLAPALDEEMAALVHQKLRDQDINVVLGQQVRRMNNEGQQLTLQDGTVLTSDMTIVAMGLTSESELAKQAGLEIGEHGGVSVNTNLQTTDSAIYAVGAVVESNGLSSASFTNRQGRAVADHIYGKNVQYSGSIGTTATKVFDLTVAATGQNEKTLSAMNIPYEVVHIHPASQAGYYIGGSPITLKMTFHPETGEIYGAQAIGLTGVDKRIDVLATAIKAKMNVFDLQDLELISSPVFSTPKDPVNMLGYVAGNIVERGMKAAHVLTIDEVVANGGTVIDVREPFEREMGHIKGSENIPLGELTARIDEISKDRPIYVSCQVGQRGYLASNVLKENGFDVYNVSGGYKMYAAVVRDQEARQQPIQMKVEGEQQPMTQSIEPMTGDVKADVQLNCLGLQCPGPISQVFQTMNQMNDGEVLEVKVTDPGFISDVKAWCSKTGNTFLKDETMAGTTIVYIRKGTDGQALTASTQVSANSPKGATLVVFDQDLDKAIASFIIATGAAAMGKKVTMFFTFWGLNILRREEAVSQEGKDFIEKMFSKMMPRGPKQLPISNMNMGGMGAKMIRSVMEKKNVDSLEKLMATAMDLGVEITACAMSMDVMGIQEHELIDGVQIGGVASYLGQAEDSNVNLFI
ncbi:FAD-dependent oxidoreductase [Bacillus sp. REN10]|uniref:FAD-dependent oxidoreductase n=1 Tax=Bacillus sp. REN10 TaxID=2782541 RepID=UPI00193B5795|nr:FAD-dependent oxidoreductase [Bacillus sp. REN10]